MLLQCRVHAHDTESQVDTPGVRDSKNCCSADNNMHRQSLVAALNINSACTRTTRMGAEAHNRTGP
jgi:hypothetical protein